MSQKHRTTLSSFPVWSLLGVVLLAAAVLAGVHTAAAQSEAETGHQIFLPALSGGLKAAAAGEMTSPGAQQTAAANTPVSGAVFTTVNPDVDGAGKCLNGGPGADAGLVNCNIYARKQYVWLSGGPEGNQPALSDGTYFFAVLVPGGQGGNNNPNDCTEKNLSDTTPCATSNTGAGDAWTNRVFTVSGGNITYGGTHDFDNTHAQSQYGKIRLMPYDDTTNPGGEYILAVCNLADATDIASQTANPPGVDPSDCKFDAFKVNTSTVAQELTIDKTAVPAYDMTYTWTIAKSVDNNDIKSSGSADANYTVAVTHDDGSSGSWVVKGKITVGNPNGFDVSAVDVTDAVNNGGSCIVTNGAGITVPGNGSVVLDYTCTYAAAPNPLNGTNTATATWFEGSYKHVSKDVDFDFGTVTPNAVDECVSVNDSYAGVLGTVCVGDPNPKTFTYKRTLTGTPGACTSFDNTAGFTTNDTGATGSASQTVQLCVGADLAVSKTANPAFTRTYNWAISKAVDKTKVKQVGGTATFNYTVNVNQTGFTDSAWVVKGAITVNNPNNWQSITAGLSDAVDNGGACTFDDPSQATVVLPASGSVNVNYTCTYASAPAPANGVNTATATWDAAAAYTPHGSATGAAAFAFTTPTTTVNKTISVQDTFNGATTTLGTLTATDAAPYAGASYKYARTIPVPAWGCLAYPNTAKIVETNQSAGQSVTVCGPIKTGALTIGYWQNKNGQGIITGGASTGGVCNSAAWLRQFAPFQDLSATATCSQAATYVYNIIKAANASGAAMNAMLKAQMLATALDVYFSNPALGGNKIGAPAPIGGVAIDLTQICRPGSTGSCQNVGGAFGGATSLTVSQMLSYAAGQSNAGGSTWYGNVKATQELAKNAFDAINNEIAFAP